MKRKVLIKFIIFLLLCAGLIGWTVWGNTTFGITRVTVEDEEIPESFSGYKIVHISDLHNDEFGEGNSELLMAVGKEKPDIIAVTGDVLDSYDPQYQIGIDFMTALAGIAPTYYVGGNHEVRLNYFSRFYPEMEAAGVVIAENKAIDLTRGDDSITLYGAEEYSMITRYSSTEDRVSQFRQKLEAVYSDDGFSLLLSHHPELADVYSDIGYDLVLSGHAHGGQVRLPFVGGLFSPGQGVLPRYDSGVYDLDGSLMIVSRGLGNSRFPFRVNNRPEIIVIELQSK
ncbi:MAG: metallophosphoesterase [Clostridia bacterium]|nr:metallophosphoesterase [Clostridia bacterium]